MKSSVSPLADKLALVTGASGIIGSAVARRLARDGASVIVHFNSAKESASALVDEIEADGGEAVAIGVDLALADGVNELIRCLDRTLDGRFSGRLDILVNNAGIFEYAALVDTDDESFDRLFTVNVRTCFQLSREAAKRMTKTGWGRIINMGSVFRESTPAPGLGTYAGTKFAVRGLTRAWSRDLGPAGITVNNIQPALIQPLPPPESGSAVDALKRFSSVGRFGTATDIANAVAFLADPKADYINGESLTVDGGWSA